MTALVNTKAQQQQQHNTITCIVLFSMCKDWMYVCATAVSNGSQNEAKNNEKKQKQEKQ